MDMDTGFNQSPNKHKGQMLKYLQEQHISTQITEIIRDTYHEGLQANAIKLNRLQRETLLQEVFKAILTDLLAGVDK